MKKKNINKNLILKKNGLLFISMLQYYIYITPIHVPWYEL